MSRSALAKYAAGMRDPDPAAARRLGREAYHATGFVVLDPAWLTSWTDRKQLELLAEKVHGRRKVPLA